MRQRQRQDHRSRRTHLWQYQSSSCSYGRMDCSPWHSMAQSLPNLHLGAWRCSPWHSVGQSLLPLATWSNGFRNGPGGPHILRDPSRVIQSVILLEPSASRGIYARCTRFPTSVSSGQFAVLPRFDHASSFAGPGRDMRNQRLQYHVMITVCCHYFFLARLEPCGDISSHDERRGKCTDKQLNR